MEQLKLSLEASQQRFEQRLKSSQETVEPRLMFRLVVVIFKHLKATQAFQPLLYRLKLTSI